VRKFLFAVLVFAACSSLARAADLWSTAIAERPRDGRKIIHRFIDKLENPSEKLTYPIAVTLTWRYDSVNGLPSNAEADAIYKLEDIIEDRVEKRGEAKLALVSTGNNLRTWIYYVKSEALFRKTIVDALEAVNLQLQVSSKIDAGWQQLENFKKDVSRP
jgi:hypothetical protein